MQKLQIEAAAFAGIDFALVEQKIHHEDAAVQWKAPKANPAAEDRRSPLRFPVCWERLLHRHSHQERPTAEEGQSALGAGSVMYRKVPESPAGHWQERHPLVTYYGRPVAW